MTRAPNTGKSRKHGNSQRVADPASLVRYLHASSAAERQAPVSAAPTWADRFLTVLKP